VAFDEREAARAKRTAEVFVEDWRPPVDTRDELDIDYRIDHDDQSVMIYEVRPDWQEPDETMETPVAKLKYVRRRDVWKLYWIRRDGNWHEYEPVPEVGSLEKALEFVEEDENHCFWG